MSSAISIYRYAGVAATAVWTFGWVVAASHAWQHFETASDSKAWLNLIITGIGSVLGVVMTLRAYRRLPDPLPNEKPEAPEPWSKRVIGWVAMYIWCGAAIVWNLGVFRLLSQAATQGQPITMLLISPFSIPGWFLLNVLFATLAYIIQWFFNRDETVKRWP